MTELIESTRRAPGLAGRWCLAALLVAAILGSPAACAVEGDEGSVVRGKEGDRSMFSAGAETLANASWPKNGPVPARPVEPAATPPSRGDSEDLAEQYIDAFMLRERLKAENEFLQHETDRIRAAGQSGAAGRALLDELRWTTPATRLALARMLQENAKPLLEDVELATAQLGGQVQKLRANWLAVRTSINRDRARCCSR